MRFIHFNDSFHHLTACTSLLLLACLILSLRTYQQLAHPLASWQRTVALNSLDYPPLAWLNIIFISCCFSCVALRALALSSVLGAHFRSTMPAGWIEYDDVNKIWIVNFWHRFDKKVLPNSLYPSLLDHQPFKVELFAEIAGMLCRGQPNE